MRVKILTIISFSIFISITSIYFWQNRIEIISQKDYFLLINKFTGNYCVLFPDDGYHYDDYAIRNFELCDKIKNKIKLP